jgi:hypothetical protein
MESVSVTFAGMFVGEPPTTVSPVGQMLVTFVVSPGASVNVLVYSRRMTFNPGVAGLAALAVESIAALNTSKPTAAILVFCMLDPNVARPEWTRIDSIFAPLSRHSRKKTAAKAAVSFASQ